MATMTLKDLENVVPGSSMTKEKGRFPFDGPAKITDAEDGIQMVFDSITSPKSARELIRTLEMGVPIDKVVDTMVMMFHGEGIVSPQALPIMVPAMVAMIEKMAEMAGVPIKHSTPPDPSMEPDERRIEMLIAEMSSDLVEETGLGEEEVIEEPLVEGEEVNEMGDEPQGLMSPPVEEGIV